MFIGVQCFKIVPKNKENMLCGPTFECKLLLEELFVNTYFQLDLFHVPHGNINNTESEGEDK